MAPIELTRYPAKLPTAKRNGRPNLPTYPIDGQKDGITLIIMGGLHGIMRASEKQMVNNPTPQADPTKA